MAQVICEFCRMLSWEDGYYDNHGPSRDMAGNSCDGELLHDYLGLAFAKMSDHVYSLGEGYDIKLTHKLVYILHHHWS